MSGQVGDLSVKQAEIVQTFRANVSDILHSDHDEYFLLRWLRARNFDVGKAETMLRNSMDWRKNNNIDNILEDLDPPEVLRKYFTGGCCGVDKEGCPVRVDPVGNLDFQGIMRSAKKSDIIKYKIYQVETVNRIMEEQKARLGRNIETETVIVDVEKVGMRHVWRPAINLYAEMVKVVEDNYPERLKRVCVVNAPSVFSFLWRITKPFLPEKTVTKIQILGSSYQSKLLQLIDADQLPAAYGGTKVGKDGDPYCRDLICIGGEVPKEYYSNLLEIDKQKFTDAVIPRGSSIEIDIEVFEPDTVLGWQFVTDNYDISFGIYRRTKPGKQKISEMDTIVKARRVDSNVVPEDGCVICWKTGMYVIQFDNTYSYTRSKIIHYTIDLLVAGKYLVNKETESTQL